jgi:lambda family phage portal protein
MRLLTRFSRMVFGAPKQPPRTISRAAEEPTTMRRYEAAQTDRLNKGHWQGAIAGQPINADLEHSLERLRARASYELANNPLLEGVINTFCTDVVGDNGPGLQINSDQPEYNQALERVVRDALENIDAGGRMSLADYLALWVGGLWKDGEFLGQIVTDPDEPGPIKTKIKELPTRRLSTPANQIATANVTLGVKRNQLGRALSYFIADFQLLGVWEMYTGKFSELPARDVIHEFITIEAGQVRGQPWLTTSLQPMADLRDYDAQVLDAARQAADWAVGLYTDHPDAPYIEVNETAEIERRQFQTVPPGWKPMALQPPQPATNYVDYRSERQRDVGRPANMPLMMVRLDSSKHNYSSARFDAQIYRRGITKLRGWLRRRVLQRLVEIIRTEAELFAIANPSWKYSAALRKKPTEVNYTWTWQGFPHVDDEKEANGQRIRMEDGTLSFSAACLENGDRPDEVLKQLEADTEKLLDVGILPPWLRQDKTDPITPPASEGPQPEDQPDDSKTPADAPKRADLITALHAQRGARRRAPGHAAALLNLNQLRSAFEVLEKLRAGSVTPTVAADLLVAVGIDPIKASALSGAADAAAA